MLITGPRAKQHCNILHLSYALQATRILYFPHTPAVQIAMDFKTGESGKTAHLRAMVDQQVNTVAVLTIDCI